MTIILSHYTLLYHRAINQKKQVVAVVEASETCQSSFDHELGASRQHNREGREGNVMPSSSQVLDHQHILDYF
jgi:hypothetical protein